MTIANSHGWEVIGDTTFTAQWDGAQGVDSIKFDIREKGSLVPHSHFGDGVITFSFPFLFRTEEKIGLWVTGPTNQVKHGLAPLSGLVETDWSPMTFTMNWKITRQRVRVRFRAGEPICFFFPVDRTYINRVQPQILPLSENPELARTHAEWAEHRTAFNAETQIEGSDARQKGWQKDYHKGRYPPEADRAETHASKIVARPFSAPQKD